MKNFIMTTTVLLISLILVLSTTAVIADNKEANEVTTGAKKIVSIIKTSNYNL